MAITQHPTRRISDPRLVSSTPTASAPANVRISHVQLRDLIVCPVERGVLWYVSERRIIEQDILSNAPSRQRSLALLTFTPVTLSTLRLASSCPHGKDVILLAAGGQEAELFLALYVYTPRRTPQQRKVVPKVEEIDKSLEHAADGLTSTEEASRGMDTEPDIMDVKKEEEDAAGYSTMSWQHISSLVGSINNNVLLYMPPPQSDYGSNEDGETNSVSPRLVVSNNDCTVKFFDVCLARKGLRRRAPHRLSSSQIIDARYWRHESGLRAVYEGEGWGEKDQERIVRYERVGLLRLPVPVNHTSISPDGSTVLSCGDASTIYLHRILPVRDGSSLLFEPLATYTVPAPSPLPILSPPPSTSNSQTRSSFPRHLGHRRYYDSGGTYLPFAFANGAWVLAGPHTFYSDVSGVEIPPACFTTAWSADGMRFAVASQEGLIRLWDIRSKDPIAGWETGPRSAVEAGEDGTISVDAQRALFEFTGGAPPWGVRTLKFARNASGRELLVFTEHISRVHIIDANTFSTHDVLRVPHVQPSTSGQPIRDDSHLPPVPQGWSTGGVFIPPSDLRESDFPRGARASVAPTSSLHPHFVVDTSYGPAGGMGPSSIPDGAGENEINADMEAMMRRARTDLQNEARAIGAPTPRRRARALMPEVRISGAEPGNGIGTSRVLSSNTPFSRSPEPTAQRFVDMASEDGGLNRETTIAQRVAENGRYGTGHGAFLQRTNDHLRVRARERERREMDEAQDELRRRNPGASLRDDAQMEEDIVYHAALERRAEADRDRLQATRDRTLAMLERRRARLVRERAERNREQRENDHERSVTPYASRLLDDYSALASDFSRERPERVDNEGIARSGTIMIPPLSSARSEEDVRDVLAMHGISSMRSSDGMVDRTESSRTEQLLSNPDLLQAARRRPSSPSASTTSTTVSGTTSTVAQAGSLVGEPAGTSRGAGDDVNSLLMPSVRMRAAQATSRAIEEYRMEVDGEDPVANAEADVDLDSGDDSDATELDCDEPDSDLMVQHDELTSDTAAGPSSTTIRTDVNGASSISPVMSPVSATSIASMPSSISSTSSSVPNAASVSRVERNRPSPSSSSPTSTSSADASSSHNHSLPPCRELIESTDRLDVAGIAFDPRGAYMYVATVDGITEWQVKGAEEERWWNASGCL